jgi:tRNA dimethylallyltransferase
VVLGPTASGKTHLACQLASLLNGEIISADSRQVYKGLNIGTGKDLQEYRVNGTSIPHHLINILEADQQYYLHDFVANLKHAFTQIRVQQKLPIICGGTGLYLDALRKDFSLIQIKENPTLRAQLENLTKEDLLERLKKYPENLTQQVDKDSKKRILRGIEIAHFLEENPNKFTKTELPYQPYYIGLDVDLEVRKQKISDRLKKRLDEGLIEEVQSLLNKGISHERLQFFGLEYKFVSRYILQQLNKEELIAQLQTAIFQFAKRQMTWFRKMEKEGVQIHWVESDIEPRVIAETLKPLF